MRLANESLASIKRQIRGYAISRDQAGGQMQVKITTARPLTEAEAAAVADALRRKWGREIFLEKKVNKALLGGIVIQYGDNIIDGSVVRQFQRYKDMMSKLDVKKIGVTDAV
jgi:F-type H+-transporting ATPase subunit delta